MVDWAAWAEKLLAGGVAALFAWISALEWRLSRRTSKLHERLDVVQRDYVRSDHLTEFGRVDRALLAQLQIDVRELRTITADLGAASAGLRSAVEGLNRAVEAMDRRLAR